MVKITLEFKDAAEAIVALSKIDGSIAAAVNKAERQGRSDKGKPRGPYKKDETAAGAKADNGPVAESDAGSKGSAPENAASAVVSPVTIEGTAKRVDEPAAPAAIAPTAGTDKADIAATRAAVPTQEDAQKALEAVFSKCGMAQAQALLKDHGANRVRELAPEKRAFFINAANKVLA